MKEGHVVAVMENGADVGVSVQVRRCKVDSNQCWRACPIPG